MLTLSDNQVFVSEIATFLSNYVSLFNNGSSFWS